jgi:hypothetical protein
MNPNSPARITGGLCLVLLGVAVLLSGCGGGSGGGGNGTGPTFAQINITPLTLGAQGGDVVITAVVTDPDGVDAVNATVSLEGRHTTLELTSLGGSTFQNTFPAPPNPGVSPQVYSVDFTAADTQANTSSTGPYNFTVLPPAG